MTLKKLICDSCGGSIDEKTYVCTSCGTRYLKTSGKIVTVHVEVGDWSYDRVKQMCEQVKMTILRSDVIKEDECLMIIPTHNGIGRISIDTIALTKECEEE